MTKIIRKAFQGNIPENKIIDTYSTSQTDTYSCNYLNKSACTIKSSNMSHTGGKWSVITIKNNSNYSVGSGFTPSTDKITVNKAMKGVIASASLSLTSNSYSYSGDLYIYHRNASGEQKNCYQFRGIEGSGVKQVWSTPVLFTNVAVGDYFTYGHYTGSTSDSFTTIGDASTWMTVQEL